jgi:hypothetical protein
VSCVSVCVLGVCPVLFLGSSPFSSPYNIMIYNDTQLRIREKKKKKIICFWKRFMISI